MADLGELIDAVFAGPGAARCSTDEEVVRQLLRLEPDAIGANETRSQFLERVRKILVDSTRFLRFPSGSLEPNSVEAQLKLARAQQTTTLANGASAEMSLAGPLPMTEARRLSVVEEMMGRRGTGAAAAPSAMLSIATTPPPARIPETRRQEIVQEFLGKRTTAPASAALSLLNNPGGMTEKARKAAVQELLHPHRHVPGSASASASLSMLAIEAGGRQPMQMTDEKRKALLKEYGIDVDDDPIDDADLAALDAFMTEEANPAAPFEIPDLERDRMRAQNGNGKTDTRRQMKGLLARATKVSGNQEQTPELKEMIKSLKTKLQDKAFLPTKEQVYAMLRKLRECESGVAC